MGWRHPADDQLTAAPIATLLDVSVVTLMATQGWLMAPISPALAAGILILAIVFLFGADVIKIVLLPRRAS